MKKPAGNMKKPAGNTSVEGVNYAILATVDLSGQNFRVFDEPPIPAGLVRISPDGRYAAMQFQSGSAYSVVSSVSIYDFTTGNFVKLSGAPFETEPGTTRQIKITNKGNNAFPDWTGKACPICS